MHVSGSLRALAANAAGAGIPPERVLIDRYQDGENAGYPTLCKGVIWWTASAITRWKNPPVSIPGTAAGVNGSEYCFGEN